MVASKDVLQNLATAFTFAYTGSDGTRTALPIGAYDPAGRAGLTLGEARARAGELSRLHQSGVVDVREHLDAEQRLLEADRGSRASPP